MSGKPFSVFLVCLCLVTSRLAAQSSDSSSTTPTSTFTNWTGSLDASKVPKGTATISSSNAEATFLAYEAAMATADKIADRVCTVDRKSVVLFANLADIDALRNLFIVRAQLQATRRSFASYFTTLHLQKIPAVNGFVAPFTDGTGPLGATGISMYEFKDSPPARDAVPILSAVDAAVSLLALFKTDSTLTGATISADDLSLQIFVAGRLVQKAKCKGKIVQTSYSSPALQVSIAGGVTDNSPIIVLLMDTLRQQNLLQTQSAVLTSSVATPLTTALAQLQKIAGDTKTSASDKAAALSAAGVVQGDSALVSAQISLLNNFQTQLSSLTSALTGSGASALQAAVKAEALNCALTPDEAKGTCANVEVQPNVLITKMSAIGGDNLTRQNLFQTKLGFSGEVTATYLLLNGDGTVASAGATQCYGAVSTKQMLTSDLLTSNKMACRDLNDPASLVEPKQ